MDMQQSEQRWTSGGAEPPSETNRQKPPFTDSPWLWLFLYGAAAIAGLVVIAPRFDKRQERLERMAAARQRAALQSGAGPATAETSQAEPTGERASTSARTKEGRLVPLAIFLCALLLAASLLVVRWRRAGGSGHEPSPGEGPPSERSP